MKIWFEAFDGEKFDNEVACREYENEKAKKSLLMLDFNVNRNTNKDFAMLIRVHDVYELDAINAMLDDDYNYRGEIDSCGDFYWDEDEGNYINIDMELQNAKEIIEKMENFKKTLDKAERV